MFKRIVDRLVRSFSSRMRALRARWFLALIPPPPKPFLILDVGGMTCSWQWLGITFPAHCKVTLLNLFPVPGSVDDGFIRLQGDARHMPQFADGSFDLVYSNSVIEHVGTLQDQINMATEVRRVGKGYFVQTPYRHFPVEPHFVFPGWQYLPVAFRRRLLQQRRWGWMERQRDPLKAQAEVEQVRLLSTRELRWLFPDAEIRKEKLGFLTKSLVAIKPPQPGS